MNKEELEKEVERLRKENVQLKEENKELEKKVVGLEQQLSFFKNPHMPPSKQVFKKRVPQASEKLGAPRGHEGATREIPEPTETIDHFLTKCPNCNDTLGKPFDVEERIIEEVPEPQPVKITRHFIGFYDCKNCGVIAAETGLPKEGILEKTFLHILP